MTYSGNYLELVELYKELLPRSLFTSRKAPVMAYKHVLRYLAYHKYNMTFVDIGKLEGELYDTTTHHSTIINSVQNFKQFSQNYDYQTVLKYVEKRLNQADWGLDPA